METGYSYWNCGKSDCEGEEEEEEKELATNKVSLVEEAEAAANASSVATAAENATEIQARLQVYVDITYC